MKGQKIPLRRVRHHWEIYLFILPCILFVGTFMYFPVLNGVTKSLYFWDGGDVERYLGARNFLDLFTNDPGFWKSFGNALFLGCANILKMLPAIVTAVCLHRVRNERLQFCYRVGFVVPMVIPGLVTVLLWKAFYEPTNGVINFLLRETGALALLAGMCGVASGMGAFFSNAGYLGYPVCAALGACVGWTVGILNGASKHRFYLAGGIALGVLGTGFLCGELGGMFNKFGLLFQAGQNPAWLGTPKLCMLALILWGFPWVGAFGVLVYLACLQQINKDIYEAAEVDGANWFHKFRHIELPLILTQVRVMMILVIMGSINDAGLVMALFGIEGGAGGVVQVPALFMFREAFLSQKMGYACGIGVVLFTIIVIMTKLNQWLVKPAD